MKLCPRCNMQLDDTAAFCPNCGTQFIPNATTPVNPPYPVINPYDRTAEFEAQDISDNKVIAMLPYLMSLFGVLIAALIAPDSAYVKFNIRQALKLEICTLILAFIAIILFFTVIVPIAAFICVAILGVIQIICFFRVCGGKAIEAPIVRGFGFLK